MSAGGGGGFFLFTDNSTAKSCFYRGNSKSRQLHTLVLALRMLEMTHGMTIIYVVHVFGKRIIFPGREQTDVPGDR